MLHLYRNYAHKWEQCPFNYLELRTANRINHFLKTYMSKISVSIKHFLSNFVEITVEHNRL